MHNVLAVDCLQASCHIKKQQKHLRRHLATELLLLLLLLLTQG
jgi:hypothetical protein